MACALAKGAHRVIALMDMDSFECQVYKRLYPETAYYEQPWIVSDQTGRIVSATHEAREMGISREIRLHQAERIAREQKVPLTIFKKPNEREKPDNKEVRYASWDIMDALQEYAANYAFGMVIEYSSSDEFYMDITDEVELRIQDKHFATVTESRTFLELEDGQISGEKLKDVIFSRGYNLPRSQQIDQERRLLCGGLIMQEVVNFVFSKTKFIGSAGVGSNKLIAKLAVSLNKPNGITILPELALSRLGKDLKIEKIPGFGGTTGLRLKEQYNIATMQELQNIPSEVLEADFGMNKGIDIYLKCRGISEEPVMVKYMTFEVSCGKTFNRNNGNINSDEMLQYYLQQLIEEMYVRLGEERQRHKREPRTMRFSCNYAAIPGKNAGDRASGWSHSQAYEPDKSCYEIGKEVLLKIFQRNPSVDYSVIKITRLEVRAKGFVTIA